MSASHRSNPVPSKQTALNIALGYISRGWKPVPVPFKSKGPKLESWEKITIDSANAALYFNSGVQNVGVQLGLSSKGLTDVDLDCDEAIKLAPYVLPPTETIFGRASARASHWVYISDLHKRDDAVINFDDPRGEGKARLAELRIGGGGKGAQTVFPGSVHESGEAIFWQQTGDPAVVDGDGLYRRVALLAACCLLARYWPKRESHQRHDAALTVGGFLARVGVEQKLIENLIQGICWVTGDEEGRDRRKAAKMRDGFLPRGFPKLADAFGSDIARRVADWLDYDFAGGDRSSASQLIEPTPLFPPLPPPQPHPLQALGGLLAKGAAAIARKVQLPEATAAQSVLAAAALVAQAHADVCLPYGQTRPLSLFFVSISASGDRKTTADNEALWPIRAHEKNLNEIYRKAYDSWRVEHDAWAAEKRKIEGDKKLSITTRKQRLTDLGPTPPPPLFPFLTAAEPTVEGLIKNWPNALPALGIFSAEGGQFIGGHGMTQEHRLKTAATLSEMWDGRTITRVRAGDGVTVLQGRRLSAHLMVQPDASVKFLGDPLLRDQGLLSRFLVSQPESLAGTRSYRNTEPKDQAAIRAYGARLLAILEMPLPLVPGTRNELDPPVLVIAPDAKKDWIEFYDAVERKCSSLGVLGEIVDFAAKVAEHAARIAGVLTIVNDVNAREIDAGAMGNAILIADWHVNETLRLQRYARTDPKLLRAQMLLEWLWKQGSEVNFRSITQLGPLATRKKESAEEALATLKAHGWVFDISGRPRRIGVIPQHFETVASVAA